MADVITDGVAVFRRSVDRWVKSPNPIDAHHALKAAPTVLQALDDARAELKDARGLASTYRLNYEALARRAARVRALADDLHEQDCPVDGTRPGCPGCWVLTAVNSSEPGGEATR